MKREQKRYNPMSFCVAQKLAPFCMELLRLLIPNGESIGYFFTIGKVEI